MAENKYKPCSFYIPATDTELLRFVNSQSNMSLSMRLLMKAFLASNRHQTDIDVSTMDLYDLIRSMRVDPELFETVPRRLRAARSISAVEAEELKAAAAEREAARAGQAPAPEPPPEQVRESAVGSGEARYAPSPTPYEPAYRTAGPEPAPQPAARPAPEPVPAAAGPAPDAVPDPMEMMGEGF